MKCPMQRYEEHLPDSFPTIDFFDCVTSECAWSEGSTERCSIPEIAVQLRSVNAYLVKVAGGFRLT